MQNGLEGSQYATAANLVANFFPAPNPAMDAESRDQSIDRLLNEAKDYLDGIAMHFFPNGTKERVILGEDPAREIRNYVRQEKITLIAMARLYVEGSIPEAILSSQSEELNNRRMALESNRRSLLESAPQAIDVKQLKERLPEAAARLREWVLECSGADMELILKGLSVQVKASHEEIHIEGTAPIMIPEAEKLVTIVQTSA